MLSRFSILKSVIRPNAISGLYRCNRFYDDLVIDHYEHPRNVGIIYWIIIIGSLDKNAKDVGTGVVGAPACGDVMKLQVLLILIII